MTNDKFHRVHVKPNYLTIKNRSSQHRFF